MQSVQTHLSFGEGGKGKRNWKAVLVACDLLSLRDGSPDATSVPWEVMSFSRVSVIHW